MSIKSIPGGGGGNDSRLHVSDDQPDSSIVTEGDLWSKTTANELFRATDSSTFVSVETTGSGSMTTVKEAGVQLGGADIEILDFLAGFDLTESPDKEINISLDFTEVTVDPATLILPNSAAPSPTAEADMQWETDRNVIRVGDGAATKEFQPVVDATSDPADVSTAAADGTEDTVARKDHVHNAAEAAITQHEAAIDHDALTNFVAAEHKLEAAIDHDALTNFVAGEHIAEASIDHDALTNFAAAEHRIEAGIEFIIDGGGSTITTGIKGDLEIPFACTITAARMFADQSGSIVVDIWKDTFANFPPTDADSITASAVPTISTAVKSEDATLTGWTTAVSKGDIIRWNVDSVTDIQRVTMSLSIDRT